MGIENIKKARCRRNSEPVDIQRVEVKYGTFFGAEKFHEYRHRIKGVNDSRVSLRHNTLTKMRARVHQMIVSIPHVRSSLSRCLRRTFLEFQTVRLKTRSSRELNIVVLSLRRHGSGLITRATSQ